MLHNTLASEFEAAARYGMDPDVYFAKPRRLRALMTAWVIAEGAGKSMRDYDMIKEREHK